MERGRQRSGELAFSVTCVRACGFSFLFPVRVCVPCSRSVSWATLTAHSFNGWRNALVARTIALPFCKKEASCGGTSRVLALVMNRLPSGWSRCSSQGIPYYIDLSFVCTRGRGAYR